MKDAIKCQRDTIGSKLDKQAARLAVTEVGAADGAASGLAGLAH
jgi:hypothetical protein